VSRDHRRTPATNAANPTRDEKPAGFEIRQSRRETLDKLMGTVDPGHIRPRPSARIPSGIIEALRSVDGGLTELVADALDELGIDGAIPGSVLVPILVGTRVVGPALTFKQVPSRADPHLSARARSSSSGLHEVHYQAQAGDVLVIEGLVGVSSLGGIMARLGRSRGEVGAVVDGSVRNVALMRRDAFPVWARGVTPITGKWRLDAVEINGSVVIAGVPVNAGDLVVADDSGVCFVPGAYIARVYDWVAMKAGFERTVFANLGDESTKARTDVDAS